MKRWTVLLTLALILSTIQVNASNVFSDISGTHYEEEIITLFEQGYIKGNGEGEYKPEVSLKNAEALQLIVNISGLNIDNIRFIKQPEATDYFVNADNDAWYANALIIMGHSGLIIDKEMMPSDAISKEDFIYLMTAAIEKNHNLPMVKIAPHIFEDQHSINESYLSYIQRALNYGVFEVNEENSFNPDVEITRGEAAFYSSNLMSYVKQMEIQNEKSSTQLTTEVAIKDNAFGYLLKMTVINPSYKELNLLYPTSEQFNFTVYNSQDEVVYDLASVSAYLQALTEVKISAEDQVTYEATWDGKTLSGQELSKGNYKIVFSSDFTVDGEKHHLENSLNYIKE